MNNIELIKNIDLVTHIGKYTTLHHTGAGRFRGPCPIHKGTKKENFLVDSTTGYWKCFSDNCGGGSIIDFTLKMGQANTIQEAITLLAKEHHIQLTEPKTKPITDKDRYHALQIFTQACENYLDANTPESNITNTYLQERGITEKSINTYRIGLVPPTEKLLQTFKKNNVKITTAQDLGLLRETFRGIICPVSHRLLLPLINTQQKPVGFSSRTIPEIKSSQETRKYVNSTTSNIYNKSELAYGEHLIDKNTQRIIIVEGNLDAIIVNQTLTEFPKTQVIATSGSAFTPGMLKHLPTPENTPITLYFDTDDGGDKAYTGSLWLLNTQHPTTTLPITLKNPERNTDPAETLTLKSHKGKIRHIKKLLESKTTLLEYLQTISIIKAQENNITDTKTLAKNLSLITPHIPEPHIRREYITTTAKRAEINPETLKNTLTPLLPKRAINTVQNETAAAGTLIKELLTIPNPNTRDHIIQTLTQPNNYTILTQLLDLTPEDNTIIHNLFGVDIPTKPGSQITDEKISTFLEKYVWNDPTIHTHTVKTLARHLLETTNTPAANNLSIISAGPEIKNITGEQAEYLWTYIITLLKQATTEKQSSE